MCELEAGTCQRHLPSASAIESCAAAAADLWHTWKEVQGGEWGTHQGNWWNRSFSSVQSLSPVTLSDPMDCSTPGLPVHHQLPELTQTYVHWVGDAIQPSHPLVIPFSCLQSFPSSESSLVTWLFTTGGQNIGDSAPVLPINIQDWLPCTPRDSQESSPTPQFKSINSSALSLLHSPTLTSIHDHRKNHSLD